MDQFQLQSYGYGAVLKNRNKQIAVDNFSNKFCIILIRILTIV